MRIIDLMIKDIVQIVRDWKAAVFLVAMPIAFTLLMGFIFGAEEGQDARLPVGYLDQDQSAVSGYLLDLLETSDVVRPMAFKPGQVDKLRRQVGKEELTAGVIVPAGYGKKVLSGGEARLQVILDPHSAAGSSAQNGLVAASTRLMGGAHVAELSAQAFEVQSDLDEAARRSFLEETLGRSVEEWREPPLTVAVTEPLLPAEEEETKAPSGFAHSSPGTMVQFAMMGVLGSATIVVLERKHRTMPRMLTTAISRSGIVLGHFLAIWVLVVAQMVLTIAFGDLVLGLSYTQRPAALAVMLFSTSLFGASMGLLIGVVARTEEQVVMLSIIPALVLSGLGGAWMPLEFTGKTFQTIGRLTPVAWAMDGFENILVRGMGVRSVLLPGAILLAWAVGLLAIAVWRFRFE